MTKKKSEIIEAVELTDDEHDDKAHTAALGLLNEAVENSLLKTAIDALITSGVLIDYSNPQAPVFRVGHYDHVMNAWNANPAQAWRDYEYELTVILAADGNALG